MKHLRGILAAAALASALVAMPSYARPPSAGAFPSSTSRTSGPGSYAKQSTYTPDPYIYKHGGYSKPAAAPPVSGGYSKQPMVAAPAAAAQSYSGGYSKQPMAAAPAAPVSQAAASGYSKPPVAGMTSGRPAFAATAPSPAGALSAASAKQASGNALAAYQRDRASLKARPQPVDVRQAAKDPVFASVARDADTGRFVRTRTRYYDDVWSHHRDVYSFYSGSTIIHRNYGVYDGGFLTGLFLGALADRAASAQWAHAHQYDPWYAQYHADLMRQAQESHDVAMQARISDLDAQVASLQAQHAPSRADALPPGVDPAAAIAPEALIAAQGEVSGSQAAFQSPDQTAPSHHGHGLAYLMAAIMVAALVGGVLYFASVGRRR